MYVADLSMSRGCSESLQKARGTVGIDMSAGGARKPIRGESCEFPCLTMLCKQPLPVYTFALARDCDVTSEAQGTDVTM